MIAGIQLVSLIDYPGNICTTIFTQGCNFKCGYCHNPDLTELDGIYITERCILTHIRDLKDKIDGICLTGGEPLIHPITDLAPFLKQVKRMGLKVKLDTNGSYPGKLQTLLNKGLIDYVAMDIKAPLDKYSIVTNSAVNLDDIQLSVDFIKKSKVDYEFRTTVLPLYHTQQDLTRIGQWLSPAKKYVLQLFNPNKTLDPKLVAEETYSEQDLTNFKKTLAPFFETVELRI